MAESRWLLLLFVAVAFDDGQNFVFAHDEVFLAIELDFLAGILAEENQVARLDVEWDAFAVVFRLAVAGGDDFALLGLFFRGVWDDDAADFLLTLLDALDNDAVVQRSDVHALCSVDGKRKKVRPLCVSTQQGRLLIIWEGLALSTVDC